MNKTLCVLALGLFSIITSADEGISSAPLFFAVLKDFDDKSVALEHYRGTPLVVNFWASWCAPCRTEIPELLRFRAINKGKVEILGIGLEDKAGPLREFAQAHAIDYPIFIAKEQGIPLMRALGNKPGGLPYTLFIDRHGQIVKKKVGVVSKTDIDAISKKLLAR